MTTSSQNQPYGTAPTGSDTNMTEEPGQTMTADRAAGPARRPHSANRSLRVIGAGYQGVCADCGTAVAAADPDDINPMPARWIDPARPLQVGWTCPNCGGWN
jgi:hypothetical protein